jgi:hypothetical protein
LYTLRPASFDARQSPWNDEVDTLDAAGAGPALSVVLAEGVCANAALASMAEPARAAMVYLANIQVLLSLEMDTEKTRERAKRSAILRGTVSGTV